MLAENILRALALVIYNISIFVLIFSIFRMRHLAQVHYHIVAAGTILGLTIYLVRFVLNSPYYSITTVISMVVLLTTIFRYSTLYSLIIGVTTFIIYVFIEIVIVAPPIYFGWLTADQIANTFWNILFCIISTVIILAISYLFKRKNIGFSFVTRKYQTKQILKKHNFLWCIVLICGVVATHFLSMQYQQKALNAAILILLAVVFFITIIYAYVENKKSVRDRYGH